MTESEAIKKAIRYFESVKNNAVVVIDSGFKTHQKELDLFYRNRIMYAELIINALEKQVAKKPIIYTTDKDRLACCPVCDSNVDWTYEGFWRKGNPKYCKDCGQRIDWSK